MAVLCHVLSIFHRRRPGKASTIMRRLTTACLLIFTALSVVNAQALVEFDFEQKFLVETEPLIKDHCLIRENGVFHLFYLRGDPAIDIGHASSTDLIHWTVEDAVLSVEPGTWDDRAMWAPQVFKIGNGWMMYYTGVNLASSQQTGIAFSTDLYDWFKLPWPVYHPDPLTWAEWSPNAFSHGRDPFVFEHEGLFYMLNTAKTWFNKGAVACAVSTDGFAWQDAGPLFVNNTWHVMESLQCLERNGRFHMFFTEEAVAGTSHMSSDSLASGWNIANRRVIDFGHAAEVTPFDGHYIFSRHAVYNANDGTQRFIIRLDTLKWAGEVSYVSKPWPLQANWTQTGNAFSAQPTFLNNPAVRGDSVDVGFEGLCWLSSFENYQGPLGSGLSGAALGDGATGTIQSRTFTITGNSINLLVGGGDYPDDCYVALIDANTQETLFKETGKNTDAMDRRFWDVQEFKGNSVYIEITDNATSAFGHISTDDIQESFDKLSNNGIPGDGRGKDKPAGMMPPNAPELAIQLFQNNPNPFNPITNISYYLPEAARVAIDIFDVSGRRVRRLTSGQQGPGSHTVRWDGTNDHNTTLSTGIYFYRLIVDGRNVATRKMMLLK